MLRLKRLLLSLVLVLPAFFLTTSGVFAVTARCTSARPNQGAVAAYPAACSDAAHWCDSNATCVDRGYNTSGDAGSTFVEAGTNQNAQQQAASTNRSPTCDGGSGVNTPFGCISYDLTTGGLAGAILPVAVGIGGALSLILMLYGFFIISTSAGIPDKVKAGQEIITSAVGGLLFVIFSVVLMNLIGVNILGIPGL